MTGATYEDHGPQSLMPAPGWRAAYIHDPTEGGAGWSTDPLLAFAVCHVIRRPCMGSSAQTKDMGHEIHGYVFDDYIQCAESIRNFWRYLAPGDPDPSIADIAARQAITARAIHQGESA